MRKMLVVLSAVVAMVAFTGCTNPVSSTIKYESESTNMTFENPQTGEVEFVDLED